MPACNYLKVAKVLGAALNADLGAIRRIADFEF